MDARPHRRPVVRRRRGGAGRVGRFALRERIGAGGMGAVWAAHDPELEREVALEVRFERGEHARLRREAQVLASLRHEYVVAVHEVGTWNTVQIAPPSVGTYECTISIPTNDTDENPFEIVVQGERVASN